MTNLFLGVLLCTNSVVLTNWVSTGDFQRRHGTNYVEQYLESITTTQYRDEVVAVVSYKTNRVPLKVSREVFSATNSVVRMVPAGLPPLPVIPGQFERK